ncbi:HAD-IC family P-type ATPase [Leptolyngbya sp. FACHB-17]|uniref:HAD-IC family P-type ATPase n=1 Tax=unclassified Leptolyngbya TaxID=2650499 RepID=UPI00168191C3|nr:HAD-IC family P-type ATPase [Leptolyngbya sp. FACHB-17]MBD2079188.1 HAD-IC family P-type ATPase [Leptolyngbya sp. FACHB-17]
MATLPGLSDRQVRERVLAGETNNVKLPTSRSYARIFQENLLTFVNAVFFAISGVFILLRRPSDAIFVAVVIFSGVVIGIVQEIWAKQKLDEIALLSRPHATVIRNGEEINIDPSEIVLGDTLVLRPGDQVLVDGEIVGAGRVEVDESLLTGESDLIVKVAGKPVYSGSFCASGSACYEAQKVGTDTVAYQITMGAREFRQVYTPLQAEINLIIRILLLLASFLWLLIGISFVSRSQTLNEVVQRAAVIAGLIPAGLILAITLSYAMGSIRMLGQNVLIQQTNAVESLSNVDVLCLDKTGTLTTNQIELHSLHPIARSELELRSRLGDFAASTQARNRTSEAVLIACGGYAKPIRDEIPFSSARKWSAIEFADHPGTYILGAPEILMKATTLDDESLDYIDRQVNHGYRVVLFAYTSGSITLESISDSTLPELTPLGILCFSDQLRPSARETLQGFVKAGITLKIISGDNPQTVAALAKQADFSDDIRLISGTELAQMDEAQLMQAARNYNVFGRITPQQKAQLVRSLRKSGHYVAMTGDGVNDVLSLKQANLGIAMESGSKATRSIADIVLLKDSFEALPHTFLEGQRIQNGIRDVIKLFMVRLSCVALLIFAIAIVSDSFPLLNKHSAIVTLIGVGIPTTFIPIWAQPGELQKRSLVRSMLHFVVPATITITLVSLTVYLFYLVSAVLDLPPNVGLAEIEFNIPRTALVTILVFCELLLIPFLKPPTNAWTGGEPLSGDWRYTIVAVALLVVYLLILAIPPLRVFFELSPLSLQDCLFLGLVAIEWALILRLSWRTRFLDRFLGVDLE